MAKLATIGAKDLRGPILGPRVAEIQEQRLNILPT